jgi:hypothetical protein
MLHRIRQKRFLRFALCVLGVLCGGSAAIVAQPDPRQMAGIPRPVDDLPTGSVSVRVIRGAMTNNVANQPVQLQVGPDLRTVNTDAQGRAQFDNLPAGAALKASSIVDGERLESETFPAPSRGGIRLLLVASGSADPGGTPAAAAVTGDVIVGGQTRIIVQPGDEAVSVYYLLEILNKTSNPVTPATPFAFDMPSGAGRTGILQGSSPLASVNGRRVQIGGPFPPGGTVVNVGTEITVTSGHFDLEQQFPAAVEQLAVIVQKVGDTKVSSPHIVEQREVAAEGQTYIAGASAPVAAGQPIRVSLSDMPHHSAAPRRVAVGLALTIVAVGLFVGTRRRDEAGSRDVERKRLLARRDKLMSDLVRLEREQHGDARYAARREEIVAALEHVYGALDSDDTTPGSGHTAGVVA